MKPNGLFANLAVSKKWKGELAGFCKVRDKWGEFSNMHGGFPITVGGLTFKNNEVLYQCLKFPKYPDFQRELMNKASPIMVKRSASAHRNDVRDDWFDCNIYAMWWCLKVKYKQHKEFRKVLKETGDRDIVELLYGRKDFWGASSNADGTFTGENMLGRLLMKLRDEKGGTLRPLNKELKNYKVKKFKLLGKTNVE